MARKQCLIIWCNIEIISYAYLWGTCGWWAALTLKSCNEVVSSLFWKFSAIQRPNDHQKNFSLTGLRVTSLATWRIRPIWAVSAALLSWKFWNRSVKNFFDAHFVFVWVKTFGKVNTQFCCNLFGLWQPISYMWKQPEWFIKKTIQFYFTIINSSLGLGFGFSTYFLNPK